MTLRHEYINAIIYTEQFLIELLDPKKTPRVPRAIRKRALQLLRHYPNKISLSMLGLRQEPLFPPAEEAAGK